MNGYEGWEYLQFPFGGFHMQMALGWSILNAFRGSKIYYGPPTRKLSGGGSPGVSSVKPVGNTPRLFASSPRDDLRETLG